MHRWLSLLLLLPATAAAQSAPALEGYRLNEAYRAPKQASPCTTGVYLRMIFRPGPSAEPGALAATECAVSQKLTLTVFADTIRMMQLDLGAPPADSTVTLWRLNRARLTELLGRGPDQAAMPIRGELELLSMIWNAADSTGWIAVGMFRISRGGGPPTTGSSLLLASCLTPRGAQPAYCRPSSSEPAPAAPH